jgi:uncharacterized protein (TIGR02145 family)
MKQGKRIQMLLLAALSGLSVMGYAQGKACHGTAYEIKELSAPSAPSTFQWVENGQEILNANSATYTIPAGKPVGRYTYLRNSLKEGCEWASSNIFTVDVITCGTITVGDPVGKMGSFQDPRDNKVYKIVKMPDERIWFAENLNYQKDLVFNQSADVANGVPFTTSANGAPAIGSFWCPATAGAVASSNKNTCGVYGALYTWETAMMVDGKWADESPSSSTWDETWVSSNYFESGTASAIDNKGSVNNARGDGGRGICPTGWHVPTDYEWAVLLDAVDDASTTFTLQPASGYWGTNAGVKLKSSSTYLGGDPGIGSWLDSDNRGSDAANFGVVPAGSRSYMGSGFQRRGEIMSYWSSTPRLSSHAWRREMLYGEGGVYRAATLRSNGYSLRCVKH